MTRILPDRLQLACERCAQWVKSGHTPALQVCVRHRGEVVLDECWGVLGPEDAAPPLQSDSLFPVASVTKPITATLVLQMVEDGLLGLNRPAKDYLPELTGDEGGPVTFAALAQRARDGGEIASGEQ